jgi:hypothetical protein
MNQNPEYYRGALMAFKEETAKFQASVAHLDNGRIWQWAMLVVDYRTACDRIHELEAELKKLKQ